MDITSQCEGCVSISDDIVICGDSEEEHDARLLHFMNITRMEGLSLNSEVSHQVSPDKFLWENLHT